MDKQGGVGKQGKFSFAGPASRLKYLCGVWVRLDSQDDGNVWDWDPRRRIWRRSTNRGGH